MERPTPRDRAPAGSSRAIAVRPTRWHRRTYALGCRAYPSVELGFDEFVQAMTQRKEPSHAEDLFLAMACDGHAEGAWESLEKRYFKPLRALLRRRGSSTRDARDLLSELWGTLATPPSSMKASTRIGTYDGRGSLYAWLATVTWRQSTDRWRAKSTSPRELEVDEESVGPAVDPAKVLIDAEGERIVSEALERAWRTMTTRQLQVIVLKYRHDVPQKQIAQALRISAPRVTRLLKTATEKLRGALCSRMEDEGLSSGNDWPGLLRALDTMLEHGAIELESETRGR